MKARNGPARRILRNTAWEGSQQTLSMGAASVINLLLIVAMPVTEYGIFSYATALVALGTTIMTAGLTGLAVKTLVRDPVNSGSILSSILLIREIFALIGFGIIILVSLTSGSNTVIIAVLIAGLALVGRGFDAPELWYMSRLKTKRTASLRMAVTGAFFALRLAAVFLFPNLWLFVILMALETFIASSLIFFRYMRDPEGQKFSKTSGPQFWNLLRDSFPLMLSGVANQVNLRGDVIIIQSMLGSASVGIYSAAARLSELAYFLPGVIMNSTFPVLLEVRKKSGEASLEYRDFVQKSYDRAFWAGVIVSALVGSGGYFFIQLVFGEEYEMAKNVLLVHLIACPFVFMGAVYSKWILAEGVLWSSFVRHGLGAILNIVMNVSLIPVLGIMGSAIATVTSYIVAHYLACFVGRRTRIAGKQMSLAIVAPLRFIVRLFYTNRLGKIVS